MIAGSASDRFALPQTYVSRIGGNNNQRNYLTAGKTRVSAALAAERTAVLIGGPAQSNQTNTVITSSYVVSQLKNHNFSFDDGGVYRSSDPLLGCTDATANHLTRIGDKLIVDTKADRVILAPMGHNGSLSAMWNGGIFDTYPEAMIRRLDSVGLLAATYVFVLCGIGESDGAFGTDPAVFKTNLLACFTRMEAATAAAGYPNKLKFFINQETYLGGVIYPPIRTAQLELRDSAARRYAGADFDTITATGRDAGNAHFNDTGATTAANLSAAAIEAQMP